ncbi:MAG TPA: peptidoglycan editing factor PgeF [Candidatus Dormibacteraeota bacterium]|nr:peptidoglycan editing factor PgeF [Candidatus Dormibacteraeota bacterium]
MPAIPEPFDDGPPPVLQVASWAGSDDLGHGFFGRRGGFSGGELASLNLSERVGDRPWTVGANWTQVRRALPGLQVARMQQMHGTRVVRVESDAQQVGEADGMLTTQSGIGLAVLTADCVPLLASAPRHGAVMALHAGWRGTLAGIAAVGLRMAETDLGIPPADWQVALGPSIGGCCYQVEADIGRQFVDRWGAMPDAWQPAGGHGQLDLRRVNRAILVASGVRPASIVDVGPCTSCARDEFYSHRRSGGRAGRQLSLIGRLGPRPSAWCPLPEVRHQRTSGSGH